MTLRDANCNCSVLLRRLLTCPLLACSRMSESPACRKPTDGLSASLDNLFTEGDVAGLFRPIWAVDNRQTANQLTPSKQMFMEVGGDDLWSENWSKPEPISKKTKLQMWMENKSENQSTGTDWFGGSLERTCGVSLIHKKGKKKLLVKIYRLWAKKKATVTFNIFLDTMVLGWRRIWNPHEKCDIGFKISRSIPHCDHIQTDPPQGESGGERREGDGSEHAHCEDCIVSFGYIAVG